jgi:hypothetical protein
MLGPQGGAFDTTEHQHQIWSSGVVRSSGYPIGRTPHLLLVVVRMLMPHVKMSKLAARM